MSRIGAALGLISVLSTAQAADFEHGKTLHEADCTACHSGMTGGDGAVLYTRPDRRVQSYPALEAQVKRCESNLELKWFDEDVADVVQYLNQTYYKFDPPVDDQKG